MGYKKAGVLIIAMIFLFISLSFASATLEITKETVSSMAIPSLNLPAIFNLQIKNTGDADTFDIYSLVGMNLEPNYSFYIENSSTTNIVLKAYPTNAVQSSPEYLSFEYKIRGVASGLQTDDVAIVIVNLKDAFNFYIDEINPDSQTTKIHLENKAGHSFNDLELSYSSEFFSDSQKFSLEPYENKEITINLDTQKMKELLAGPYIVNAKIKISDYEEGTSTILKFSEREGIKTIESKEGVLMNRWEIEKKNEGNTKVYANIIISKNILSSLFTSFNVHYNKKEIQGFKVTYLFNQEISPGESLEVIAKTNWWILIGIIAGLIIIWYIIDEFIRNKLVLRKSVSLVRTKGGEFALKITIRARARDFIEKIKLLDRLPPMAKVFEKPGLAMQYKLDHANRRIEWNVQALAKGEEREFSYIIYSKVGVFGKYELPQADAIYEYKGNLKEANSNRAFYTNEK